VTFTQTLTLPDPYPFAFAPATPPDHPAPQPATKPLPPSPAKEGEPVNEHGEYTDLWAGWENAANAWRTYHADRTNRLVIEHARLTDSLRARLAAAGTGEGEKRYREALESIAEYWNGSHNETAMHDACNHAVDTARSALNSRERGGGK